jgi:hypothetical protein
VTGWYVSKDLGGGGGGMFDRLIQYSPGETELNHGFGYLRDTNRE